MKRMAKHMHKYLTVSCLLSELLTKPLIAQLEY